MTRWVTGVLGAILALIGLLWTLQGSNVLPGSFMSGQKLWLGIGLVVLVVGVALLVRTFRRTSRTS